MTQDQLPHPAAPVTGRSPATPMDGALDAVLRRRRESIRSLMVRVEDAVAAPLRSDPGGWLARVDGDLAALHGAFTEHLAGTEGPNGYYAGLLEQAPRLAGAVRRLVAEHRRIADCFDAVHAARERAADDVAAARERAADDVAAVGDVRDRVVDLLVLFARHRQHGSDLLWEAYGFDVGGEA